jgi:hypothetical protein
VLASSAMRIVRPLSLALVTAGLAGAVAACAAIWGFEPLQPVVYDSGTTDAPDDGAEAGPRCASLEHPPARPTTQPPGTSTTLMFAVDSLDIGVERPDGGTVLLGDGGTAYDLDGVCTCELPGQESCARPAEALANGAQDSTCDRFGGGRDNVGQSLLGLLSSYTTGDAISTRNANARLRQGRFGILVVVRDYNGTDDDEQVQVDVIPSYGLGDPATKSFTAPSFTAADRWTFAPKWATQFAANLPPSPRDPVKGDTSAYVRGGVLVANLRDVVIVLQLQLLTDNPIVIRLQDTIATARIVKDDDAGPGTYQLEEGRIAGRWASGDLLRAIGAWSMGSASIDLCPGGLAYAAVKKGACGRRDLFAGDGGAPDRPCNAFSFAMGFSAKPASAGGPAEQPVAPTACHDAGYDPFATPYPDDCQ